MVVRHCEMVCGLAHAPSLEGEGMEVVMEGTVKNKVSRDSAEA